MSTVPMFDANNYLSGSEFTLSGWFYTCQSGDFHVISRQYSSLPFSEIFSIRVDGAGQYVVSYFQSTLKTFYTGIYTYSGWNYFALSLDYQVINNFGVTEYYNTLSFHAGHDDFDSVEIKNMGFKAKIQSFTTTWSRTDADNFQLQLVIHYCIQDLCTVSFIQSKYLIKEWGQRFYNKIGQVIITNITYFLLDECNGLCGFCSNIDRNCHDKLLESFLAKIDFAAGVSDKYLSDSSGNQNQLQLMNNPIVIPYQGILFSRGKHAERPSLDTSSFQIPSSQIFCIESWFKINSMDFSFNNNYIGYLFAKYDSTNKIYKLAIGVSNGFMRIIFETNNYDRAYNFNDNKWHFIQACFRKSEMTGNTQMLLWIDDQVGADIQNFDGSYTDNTAYSVYAGKDFAGIMRSLQITTKIDWDCENEESISSAHVTSNKDYYQGFLKNQFNLTNKCSGIGSTSTCGFCSSIQYPTQNSINECFSNCSLNTFDQQCSQCDFRCKYCADNSLLTCSECNEFNYAFKNSSGLCQCSPGFFTNETKKECSKCNENCALCDNSTNQCIVCSKGSYKIYNNQCVKVCPDGYVGHDQYGICVYKSEEVQAPDFIKGCLSNQYYDEIFQYCRPCDSSCKTCSNWYSTDCLSCERGKYLWQRSTYEFLCLTCDSDGMYYGTNGDCVEKCGDSKNFGLNECDDGNSQNGDGCSSACKIEQGFICSGGNTKQKDICYAIQTQIDNVIVTGSNNLIIEFSKDVMILGELDQRDIQVRLLDYKSGSIQYGNSTLVDWTLPYQSYELMPSKLLFLKLDEKEFNLIAKNLKYTQNMKISITYLGTGKLRDENNQDVIVNDSNFSGSIYSFLMYFDFVLFEFKFIPVLIKDYIIDTYIPLRGIFTNELEAIGIYYNAISFNIFRKIMFWLIYFFVILPLSVILKRIFGDDSEVFNVWPDKFFFSGTMIIFFMQLQAFMMPAIAEIQIGATDSEYEYASYSLACLIIAIIAMIVYYGLSRPFRLKQNTIFVLVSEVVFIAICGLSIQYTQQDVQRTDLSYKAGFCFFIFTLYDSIMTLRIWKKAIDLKLPNPFHLVPSYKFRNQDLLNNSSNPFETQTNKLLFHSQKTSNKILDSNQTQEEILSPEDIKKKLKAKINKEKDDKDQIDILEQYYGDDGPKIDNDDTPNNDRSFTRINKGRKDKIKANSMDYSHDQGVTNNSANHIDFENVEIFNKKSHEKNQKKENIKKNQKKPAKPKVKN
ncbi:UNKNOWN [Stylonychia lemnae]|uniref:Insulin-like growth factor binding protein, N-terminal n=1 Tax=Stylonychia lemnae TaxID=5949 RepID=A0A078AH20_STYLE|nr:UNKNOWN [Stylonychia lemnae]|eukprot:CDW81534.1 UNKNOWN [Stylonychia lemnae]